MKVLQGPLLERGAGAGCELIPKFRKRGRAQDGPKLGPGFMPGQKKNRNSNRKMKVSGGSALPDRAGGLVFLELPVGGRMQKSKKIVQEALTNIKSTHSRWEMASFFLLNLNTGWGGIKKGFFCWCWKLAKLGASWEGHYVFSVRFPQALGNLRVSVGSGKVGVRFPRRALFIGCRFYYFFSIFILKMVSFFGSCGLVFWLVWSRFFGVLASVKNSSFF